MLYDGFVVDEIEERLCRLFIFSVIIHLLYGRDFYFCIRNANIKEFGPIVLLQYLDTLSLHSLKNGLVLTRPPGL